MIWGRTIGVRMFRGGYPADSITSAIAITIALASAGATGAVAQEGAQAEEVFTMEEMVVTAQRREQSLQEVPVAVSAFSGTQLERLQIENFSDLQFNTPNVTFTKTNFTTSSFQIRGIGETLVAPSADQGVGIHVNDVPLNAPRIFELEYFDVERVEVLRGPQGTLFGRNATGGVVNLITKRPTDAWEFLAEAEYGNFDSVKLRGAVNAPITDELAVRIAALYTNRDGYTNNLFTGNNIDGRDLYNIRGSVRWEPTDTTTIDVMVSWFEEDSDRARQQKQLCDRDPTGVLGCLPTGLGTDSVNGNGTLGGLLSSSLVLGPLALTQFPTEEGFSDSVNPPGLRDVNVDFEPVYRSDELLVTAQIEQQIDDFVLTVVGGYQDTSVFSQTDYNWNVGNEIAGAPAALAAIAPTTFNTLYAQGGLPLSAIDPGNTGILGGNILRSPARVDGYDQSNSDAEQWSIEARINSTFDGPLNFLVGGIYFDFESDFDYYVVANQLDYFAATIFPLTGFGDLVANNLIDPNTLACLVADPAACVNPLDGLGAAAPFFNSETDFFGLESWALFGELYYDITDTLKVTGGIRYTVDQKSVRDRQVLFDSLATGVPVPLGTADADTVGALPALNGFREDFGQPTTIEFKEVTGRFVLDWTPELAFTDSTLVYFSYSRGYKGGGFNPPFDASLFPGSSPDFDPEIVNAFEIGAKNTLMGGRLTANFTAFYYDYNGLQVSRIVNRTSFNDNIDASIWGLESEFLYAPDEHWLFNLNAAYLNTDIGNASIVDSRDPTNGADDVVLIKDAGSAANCVIELNGAPLPTAANLEALGVPAGQAADLGITPIPVPGLNSPGAFSSCTALATAFSALPYEVTDGIPVDLNGNELQNAPDWSISVGAQYTYPFVNGFSLTGRIDYYRQGKTWARIFNDPRTDRIDGFDNINIQVTLSGRDDRWFVRGFVQNLDNDDNITGLYLTDASSGLFTNAFTLEPRRYGAVVGVNF